MYSKHIFPTILGCIELLHVFFVLGFFPGDPKDTTSFLGLSGSPDHGSVGPGWKKDRMIENTQNVECFGMRFGGR